jgi:hypothetical protein
MAGGQRRFTAILSEGISDHCRLIDKDKTGKLAAPLAASILFQTDGSSLIPDRRMPVIPSASRL